MKIHSLSFCIPAYNDEKTISNVVSDARNIGRTVAERFEIIVINDASPDNLDRVLIHLGKKVPELRVITHTVNAGYGGTIRELYYTARNEWIFTVPGDNQIPVSEITKLIPLSKTSDMIVGQRIARHDPPFRLFQSAVYNLCLKIFFGMPVGDSNSVRLMRSAILKKITLTTQSAFVDAELILRAARAGFRIVNASILHTSRTGSQTGAGGGKLATILPTVRDMIWFALTF